MPKAAIFDIDGNPRGLRRPARPCLAGGADEVRARGDVRTGPQPNRAKAADQLIPVFLSEAEQADHGEEMEEWRGKLFKSKYLHLVRPFSAVPELLRRVHEAGLKVAAASSAKRSELEVYLDIACVAGLVDVAASSEDAEQSKPAPDIFHVALKKLGMDGPDAVAIGDTPLRRTGGGQGVHPHHRHAVRRFHRGRPARRWVRRRLSRTGSPARLLRRLAARPVSKPSPTSPQPRPPVEGPIALHPSARSVPYNGRIFLDHCRTEPVANLAGNRPRIARYAGEGGGPRRSRRSSGIWP